jgi:hypothetical protein
MRTARTTPEQVAEVRAGSHRRSALKMAAYRRRRSSAPPWNVRTWRPTFRETVRGFYGTSVNSELNNKERFCHRQGAYGRKTASIPGTQNKVSRSYEEGNDGNFGERAFISIPA